MPRPNFSSLWSSYPTERSPCNGPWSNQCAIRLSLSLNGEGTLTVSQDTYSEPKCAHGHARGAESLANWLYRKIGPPKKWTSGADAKQALASSQGIIFFKDCFTREGEATARGDHIDLWRNGVTKTFSDPDNNAKQVWFWSL
jgi:hypothetical protein